MNNIRLKKDTVSCLEKVNDKDIKILCFTDTHISHNMTEEPFQLMEKIIERTSPDLVIITGDVVTCDNSLVLYDRLGEFFSKKNLLFAIVLGNHDGEFDKTATRREIIERLCKRDNFILSQKAENIYGYGNRFVNLTNSKGEVIQSLIFLDSGDYLSAELKEQFSVDEKVFSYDSLKKNQVDWYEEKIKKLCKDKLIKSMIFLHIPPYETQYLLNNGGRIYGNILEKPCNAVINIGFIDKVIELKSTKAIFYGHDHVNDAYYFYRGINFVYVQSSGYDTYIYKEKQKDKRGGTLITINDAGDFNIEQVCLKE